MMIKDDYGWEISPKKALDALYSLVELMGEKEVLDQLAQALSTDELADCLAFICRQNDIEISQLNNKSVEDSSGPLLLPEEDREKMDGQGTPASFGVKYKGFRVVPTKEGWLDVYDLAYGICGTGYETPEAAKAAIDIFIEQYGDPKNATATKPGRVANYKGPQYQLAEYADGTYQLTIGGRAGDKWQSAKTRDLVGLFGDLIDHNVLTEKDIIRKNTAKIDGKIADRIYDLWVDEFYPLDDETEEIAEENKEN